MKITKVGNVEVHTYTDTYGHIHKKVLGPDGEWFDEIVQFNRDELDRADREWLYGTLDQMDISNPYEEPDPEIKTVEQLVGMLESTSD